MEIFEKIGKVAEETYKGAAEKTTKIAKEAKYKIEISKNKANISDLYEELGEMVYKNKDKFKDENLQEFFDKIKKLEELNQEFKLEILKIKDKKQCKKCNKTIEKENLYCSYCGENQQKTEDIIEIEEEIIE